MRVTREMWKTVGDKMSGYRGVEHWQDEDFACSPMASTNELPSDFIDTPLDEIREIAALPDVEANKRLAQFMDKNDATNVSRLAADMFRKAIIRVIDAENPQYEAWLIAMACGMECTMGISMKELGEKFGVKKQSISKHVNNRVDELGLPRNGNMMSHMSRLSQRKCQLEKHGHMEKMDERPNGRKLSTCSIEFIYTKFLSWWKYTTKQNPLNEWPTHKLIRILDCLGPAMVIINAVRDELKRRK